MLRRCQKLRTNLGQLSSERMETGTGTRRICLRATAPPPRQQECVPTNSNTREQTWPKLKTSYIENAPSQTKHTWNNTPTNETVCWNCETNDHLCKDCLAPKEVRCFNCKHKQVGVRTVHSGCQQENGGALSPVLLERRQPPPSRRTYSLQQL